MSNSADGTKPAGQGQFGRSRRYGAAADTGNRSPVGPVGTLLALLALGWSLFHSTTPRTFRSCSPI